jgi:preprotein translocase subunit SecF
MKKTINFTKYRFIMIAVSLVLLAGGLAGTLLQDGFNLGIDFRPGLNLQVEFDNRAVVIEQVRELFFTLAWPPHGSYFKH